MRSVKVLLVVSTEIRSVIQPQVKHHSARRWFSTFLSSELFHRLDFYGYVDSSWQTSTQPFHAPWKILTLSPRSLPPASLCALSPHFAIFESFLPQFCFLWRQQHLLQVERKHCSQAQTVINLHFCPTDLKH